MSRLMHMIFGCRFKVADFEVRNGMLCPTLECPVCGKRKQLPDH